jgi:nitroreductase
MLDLLRKRRSVRSFEDRPLPPEMIAEFEEVLLRSPSSRNFRPWQFVLVDDPGLIARLAKAKAHGSGFLSGAPMAIVICGLPEESDVWIEDCSIASTLVQMHAESIPGLGSCWIQITADAYVKKILNLPANWAVESIIAVGYETSRPEPIPEDHLVREKIHRNQQ